MKSNTIDPLISRIFEIQSDEEFNVISLEVFRLQYEKVPVYRFFCDQLKKSPENVSCLEEIPFLPIQFFKSKSILWDELSPDVCTVFKSSGTTLTGRSAHFVADLSVYERSFVTCFEHFYGALDNLVIIALLPSYQEQGSSSLVYMVDTLIHRTKDPRSGFYLQQQDLADVLESITSEGKKCLLIGVTYALLDLIESHTFKLKNTVIMETGGMKGRRKEMTKTELHSVLKKGFGVDQIHSEYGMTELLSQGYSLGDESFEFPKWMKTYLRPINDPLGLLSKEEKTGGINIIDLANVYSCSFISTQDLGRFSEGKLKLMGRFDHSDTRGCNLLVQ